MAHPPSASAVASSSFTSTAPPFSNTSDTGNSTEQPSIQARARRRPLSVQDVNEIDAWLARLHRLEGAQPPKESLPSRPSAIVRSASHTIETKSSSRQVEYSWNVNSNSSQSNILGHKHTRRRSLAFFTTAGTSNHLSDQVDRSHSPSSAPISHIQHSPSHGLARSGSCSPTYLAIDTPDDLTSSPRPSSHLEPACAARASIPFVSQAATATLLDKEERIYEEQREECDDPHEKEYYEVQDGSYIVLTEVGSVGSGAVESGRAHSTVHYEAIEGNNETDSHITQSTPTQEVQVSQIMSSSLPDAFNPTATISSSRSIKSFSTTSSNNTPSSSNGISGSNNITSGNSTAGNSKLQPRSPLSSPKATLSLKKGRKELSTQGVEVQSDEEEDEEAAHINVATDSNTIMKSEIQGTEHHRIASSSSGITGPLARAKKLSKSSFTSSIDSVRGSIISPASNHSPSSSLIFEKQQTGGGAGAGGRRESSDSRASSHSFPHHKHFFNRNSSKHPQTGHTQSQAQYQNPDDIETSSPKPIKAKLIARDERFYSSRGRERPRLTSARSASSLQLGGEGTRGGGVESENEGNTAEDGENEEDDDDEEALFNPRRASISSTSPSHQRSKDDKRTLLASSSSNKNHRISLAIPPPLIRSYSYDNRITAASLATSSIIAKSVLESNSGNSLDTSELARHIPDLKQNILLWVPVDEHTGANLSYHSSSYAGAGAGMSRSPSSSHNHHGPTHHHPSSSTAKGLANVLLSNVPIVNSRKKLIRRESTQVLFSDDIHEEGETVHHNKHTDFKHQQHSEEGKEKYKRKLHHHSAEKGKGRASILIPSGQWRKGEAVLKSNGSLVISSGVSTILF